MLKIYFAIFYPIKCSKNRVIILGYNSQKKKVDMKKITLIAVCIVGMTLMFTACSKTWSGVKQDSSKAWKDSKKVVHDATA